MSNKMNTIKFVIVVISIIPQKVTELIFRPATMDQGIKIK